MAKQKSKDTASAPTGASSEQQASAQILSGIAANARKAKDVDTELFDILEKHVLRADPVADAVTVAAREIVTLSEKRAAPESKK